MFELSQPRTSSNSDAFSRRVEAAIPEVLASADPGKNEVTARALVERVLAAADRATVPGGRRWTISHDANAEDDVPQAFRVSGPEIAFGSVEVMPAAEYEAELARLRAVEEAARAVVKRFDGWHFKYKHPVEVLRSALSEPTAGEDDDER